MRAAALDVNVYPWLDNLPPLGRRRATTAYIAPTCLDIIIDTSMIKAIWSLEYDILNYSY